MGIRELATAAQGQWNGINRMRLLPTDDYDESKSTALVSGAGHDQFSTFTYTWENDDGAQDGLLLVGEGETPGTAVGLWLDSWHQSQKWMDLVGTVDDTGNVDVEGTYPFGDVGTARWRIQIGLQSAESLRMTMEHFVPESVDKQLAHDGYQVVEAVYSRTTY